MADDELLVLVDDGGRRPPSDAARWKIAVIDDDQAVHDGTRYALQNYVLQGRGLELLSATSAREGGALLREHPDTAVVLLDVVMETDYAGLELVNLIRNELKNETVRIILRTGQPGQAPERRVIVDYDINDYKAKTELTADRLFTSITAALRSFEQLKRLEETRRGLEIIVEAAPQLFDFKSMQKLAEGVLTQMAALLDVECVGVLVLREREADERFAVLAGSGRYSDLVNAAQSRPFDDELHRLIAETFTRRDHAFPDGRYALYVGTASGREIVVLLDGPKRLSRTDRALIEVFCSRLSVAFDNATLYEQIQEANDTLEVRVRDRTAALTAANERLEAQSALLKSSNAFKSEILSTVAHDLKNPLGVILGRAEMLAEIMAMSPIPAATAENQIGHIRDSAKRLTSMVDSLIADAMADALDIEIRRAPVDLGALLSSVAEANRTLAARKRQSITLAIRPCPPVLGDEDRLREAIDNLVSNAIKYSPLDGRITVGLEPAGGMAEITVLDSGPGFSPEDMSRLFGRFQRLSAKPTGGETSTGLGLSITRHIIDLHKGRIAVANVSGGGACFTVGLPAEAGTA